MGTIAENVALSQKTQGIVSFQNWFERPGFLTFRDLPYLPPPYTSLLEKTEQIVEASRASARSAYEAGYLERTQSGWFPWAGPPGAPENRPQHNAPEESAGSVFNWFG